MKTASITEAKNNLSKLIDGLRSGPVLITDRGRPVARLEQPQFGTATEQGARIANLERRGILIPPKAQLPPDFFTKPLPKAPGGISVVDLVIREREEGW